MALRNFAYRLIKSDVTVIGCCGCTHELFDHSTHRQTFTGYEGIMQETCVTVTWMKLCLQMLCLTGDSAFADEMERSAFNALYGAVNTEERTENLGLPFDSYSPLLAGTRGRKVGGLKYMENDTAYYGCCACIGAAGTALFPLSNVLLSRTGIAVNFYLPGTAEIPTPAGQFCRLETQSDYPTGGAVTIRVGLVGPEAFTVSLRIPHFGEGTTVTVNGMPVPAAAGKYLHVARTWADGDEIRLEIPMTVRVRRGVKLEEDPASEHHICLTRGPLVLARDARIAGNTVGTPVRLCRGKDGSVTLTPAGRPAFPVQGAWSVETESGESVTLIDYASAGKTWNEDSRMECWLKTE